MNKANKIEKKNRPYSVVPYNKKWSEKFQQEKKIISDVFGDKAQAIEHIGSTSVEGMWAKPQIDILVIVDDLKVVDELVAQMEAQDYNYQENFNKHNERYFTRDAESGERLVSVHIIQKDDPKITSHLNLRDYLRQHPKAKELYSHAKKEAYEDKVDRLEYPKRKNKVLNQLLTEAENWGKVN